MDKFSRILLGLLILGIIASVSYTYWNYKVQHNFVIIDDTQTDDGASADATDTPQTETDSTAQNQ